MGGHSENQTTDDHNFSNHALIRALVSGGGTQLTDLFFVGKFTRSIRVRTINGIGRATMSHPRILGLEVDYVSQFQFVPCSGSIEDCRTMKNAQGPYRYYEVDPYGIEPQTDFRARGLPRNFVDALGFASFPATSGKWGELFGISGRMSQVYTEDTVLSCDDVPDAAYRAGFRGVMVGVQFAYDPLYPAPTMAGPGMTNSCVASAAAGEPCGDNGRECCVESRGQNCVDTPSRDAVGALDYTEIKDNNSLAHNVKNSSGCGAGYECKYNPSQDDYCVPIAGSSLRRAGLSGIAPVCSYVRLGVREGIGYPMRREDYIFHVYVGENGTTTVTAGAGSLADTSADDMRGDGRLLTYPSPESAEEATVRQHGPRPSRKDAIESSVTYYEVTQVPRVGILLMRADTRTYPHIRLEAADYLNLGNSTADRLARQRAVGQALARDYVYAEPASVTVITGP